MAEEKTDPTPTKTEAKAPPIAESVRLFLAAHNRAETPDTTVIGGVAGVRITLGELKESIRR